METTSKVNLKSGLIGSLVLIGLMLLVSAWGWMKIPAGQQIAIHWGISGEPDNFAGKPVALLSMPIIALINTLIFALIARIEPRKQHMQMSLKAYTIIWLGTLVVLLLAHLLIVLVALGYRIDISKVVPLMVGLLFIVLGNYMGKIRSNFFAGVRTPWTLSSELAWDKTNRLGGKLFIIYGLLLMLSAFLKDMALWLFVMISGTVILLVILTVYSYLIWKTDPHRQGNSSGTVSSGSGILPILFAITLGMILLFAGIYAYLFRSTISTIEMNHRAQQVVVSMGKGDFETAETHFDSKMLKGLPPAKLKNVWGSLVAEEGPYQKINNTRVQRLFPLPFTIIHVNTQLKNSVMDIKVVFSRSGKISGLWVSPVQS